MSVTISVPEQGTEQEKIDSLIEPMAEFDWFIVFLNKDGNLIHLVGYPIEPTEEVVGNFYIEICSDEDFIPEDMAQKEWLDCVLTGSYIVCDKETLRNKLIVKERHVI